MEGDGPIIIAMIILVILSAFFSATEMAFSSLSRSRLKLFIERGNKKAALVIKLLENYNKLLSTILVGNNIVNIATSSLATVLFIRHLGDSLGPTIATIIVTITLLLFGEISPKSLAKEAPERLAMSFAPLLQFFILILTPVNYIFSFWRKFVGKIFKVEDDRRVTDEELLTIVAEAEHEGGIDSQEGELIRSAIEFNDRAAIEILTPRVSVTAVESNITPVDLAAVFNESGLSRLPVYEDSIDNVLGVVNQKDFYNAGHGENFNVTSIMNQPVFITGAMKIGSLLKFLQKTKSHLAIVTDEFGGMLGIITMEDILEELVGEIWDEHDEVIEEFIKTGENTYKIICSADLDELFEYFSLDCESDSVTVSGWVMEQLDRIPNEGDSFTYENLTVQVIKTDNRRVMEIEVTVDPDYLREDKND